MTLNYENIKQKLKENTKLSCEKNTHRTKFVWETATERVAINNKKMIISLKPLRSLAFHVKGSINSYYIYFHSSRSGFIHRVRFIYTVDIPEEIHMWKYFFGELYWKVASNVYMSALIYFQWYDVLHRAWNWITGENILLQSRCKYGCICCKWRRLKALILICFIIIHIWIVNMETDFRCC